MTGAEILLVEDDDLNRALVPVILAKSEEPLLRDAHVSLAGTLAQARAVLAERPIDLVLLDMGLPDGSGLELAGELRGPAGTVPAVIALTGAPAEHGAAALACGCAGVLGKPYRPAELRSMIAAQLGQRQPEAAATGEQAGIPGPVQPGPVQPGPVQPGPVQPGPVQPGPVQTGAVQPGSVHPEATQPGAAATGENADVSGAVMRKPSSGPARRRGSSSADFGLLFSSVPGMYAALDLELNIVAVSDAYARAIQAAPADLMGKTLWEVLPEDPGGPRPCAPAGLRASLERVRRDRAADAMEVQKCFIPPPDAEAGVYDVRYFRPANTPVTGSDGTLCYIVHSLDDVTDHVRELEQANLAGQAADEAKTRYVSKVNHEIRSPINTILGFGELLSLADLTAEHREWASMMVKAARHLADFMDDVADISHAETHALSLSIEPVPVSGVVADALELIRPLSASHGVTLEPPPPAAQHVAADQRRLRQVLLNLLSNAVKYNHPAGQVTVKIDPQPGEQLRISICDTGRGIADYDISQLFTPFQRLDAAQAGIEGAGLGLTLSRQLIEAMGGNIGATSAPGQGSVFWVELPLAQPAAIATAAAAGSADPLVEPRAYAAPKTILYVEDMLETLLLIEHILKQRPSITLVPAMLGGVALDLAAEYRPHLILLDLNLPDIPGEELLRRLKSDPATSATPVAIISADATPERIDRLVAMGASAYLTKPIGVRDFIRTIDMLLTKAPFRHGAIP